MRNRSVTYLSGKYLPQVTFHALADPTRLAVLDLLRGESRSVGQIAAAFPISRPAISKHLRQLHKARLAIPTRRGRHRFYRLNAEPLAAVDSWLERYRMLWAQNVSNLKWFVEQERAREMGKAAGKVPSKAPSKHK
ncbi:MAG: metalloregulator ArsR/SmtB family transcription factor [Terriglobales bacterium]|jgi:DNA-binding transcriptional ArsR family regulator